MSLVRRSLRAHPATDITIGTRRLFASLPGYFEIVKYAVLAAEACGIYGTYEDWDCSVSASCETIQVDVGLISPLSARGLLP